MIQKDISNEFQMHCFYCDGDHMPVYEPKEFHGIYRACPTCYATSGIMNRGDKTEKIFRPALFDCPLRGADIKTYLCDFTDEFKRDHAESK